MALADRLMGARPGCSGRLDHGRTVERLVSSLSEGIANSRYAPGQRLIEAELTRHYGVSRGPLREAFRRLSAEGLVELVPNRGAVVRRFSFREATELFEIRGELEALAVRLAAANMANDCIRANFRIAIEPIWSDASRSPSAYIEENDRFHSAIAEASDNRQLALLNRQLQLPLIMAQIAPALTSASIAESIAEHRGIANAILDAKAPQAEELMRGHLDRAMELIAGMPGDLFRAIPSAPEPKEGT
jgi:DNA-binding GntR family transcriptional regulator